MKSGRLTARKRRSLSRAKSQAGALVLVCSFGIMNLGGSTNFNFVSHAYAQDSDGAQSDAARPVDAQAEVLVDPLFDVAPAAAPVPPRPAPATPPTDEPAVPPNDGAQAVAVAPGNAPPAADLGDAVAPPADNEEDEAAAAKEQLEEMREWLREQFTKDVTSRRTLAAINRRVDRMTELDINRQMLRLAKVFEKERAAEAQAEQADEERRLAEQRRVDDQMLRAAGWGAPAVVAPIAPHILETPTRTIYDGGYPIGYGVGPTFPLDARIYVDRYGNVRPTHGSNCTCSTCRPRRRRPRVERPAPAPDPNKREVWFDGLRTRYEPRQN